MRIGSIRVDWKILECPIQINRGYLTAFMPLHSLNDLGKTF